jgi:hypothetical protein
VIVVGSAYEPFLHRLVGATRALVVGDPMNPGTDIGPVIDEEAARKIRSYIEIGKGEGRHELTLDVPAGLDATVGKPFKNLVGVRPLSVVLPAITICWRDPQAASLTPAIALIRATDSLISTARLVTAWARLPKRRFDMQMIIAGAILLLIGFALDNINRMPWLVGGFVWIAVGYLLHNLTVANEKKAKSLDQNRE